jgi:hypothetical protein
MTAMTVDVLRTSLIGAWTLQSYQSSSIDGSDVIYPLGIDARGIIMYTPDGYMSAQLMRADRTPFDRDDPHLAHDNELAAAAGGYLSYAGPFTVVNDGLIAHHVEVSLLPNWIGGIQYRKARLRDSCLELSSAEPMLMAGQPRIAKLVWTRA